MGAWKLVDNRGTLELFNLEADLGEKNDLAAREPARVKRLQEAIQNWRKAMAPRIGKGPAREEEPGAVRPRKRKR